MFDMDRCPVPAGPPVSLFLHHHLLLKRSYKSTDLGEINTSQTGMNQSNISHSLGVEILRSYKHCPQIELSVRAAHQIHGFISCLPILVLFQNSRRTFSFYLVGNVCCNILTVAFNNPKQGNWEILKMTWERQMHSHREWWPLPFLNSGLGFTLWSSLVNIK